MSGEIVSVRAADGVRLDGMHRKPEASARNGLPVDVMVLHHGVGGNFYGSSPFESFAPRLLENGCATLRVNNRGHDAVCNAVRDGVRTPFGASDRPYRLRDTMNFASSASSTASVPKHANSRSAPVIR